MPAHHRRSRCCLRHLVPMVVLGAALAGAATASPIVAAPPDRPAAAALRPGPVDVLRRHRALLGAGLHWIDTDTPDLAQLAADVDLVQPGDPDASELYNRLSAGRPAPSTQDLKTIRLWIEGLVRPDIAACGSRLPAAATLASAITARVLADLREQLPIRRPKLRYLSLAALARRCAPAYATADAVIDRLVHELAPTAQDLVPARLDADGPLWRIDLDEMAMTPAQWDDVTGAGYAMLIAGAADGQAIQSYTGTAATIARAEVLIHALRPRLGASGIDSNATHAAVTAVEADYRQPLDGDAAAAELGVEPAALRDALWQTPAAPYARLLTSLVSRQSFELWRNAIARQVHGERAVQVAGSTPPIDRDHTDLQPVATPLALVLATPRTRLTRGDLLTIAVTPSMDCGLEIIDVDPIGRATLLFPNDFQRNNLIRAGQTLLLPGDEAPYQLRLDRVGDEVIVAQCSVPGAKRARSRSEFIRQRFLNLGEWASYLERRDTVDPVAAPRRPATGRRSAPAPEPTNLISRAGVRLTISEPASSASR